jgi:hypothetical protein
MTSITLFKRHVVAPALLIALALGSAAAPNAARAADPWDQATVTAIAARFYEELREIRNIVRQAPVMQRRQQRLQLEADQNFRKMESSARQLKSDLEKGKGRDDTYLQLKRLEMLRNDTVVLVRQAAIGAETMAKLAGAGALLRELEFYYYTLDDHSEAYAGDSEGDEAGSDEK